MSKNIDIEKITVHATPEESPGYLLWRISTQWRSSIEDVLKPLNLTHPQFVVLAVTGWLTKKGARVSQVEIGRSAGLDPNTTSQIIRGLEAKKYIKRTQLADERSKNPQLTALGAQRLVKALAAVEQADALFFDPLTAEESCILLKVFKKLLY